MSLMAPPGRASDLEASVTVLDSPCGVALLTGEPGAGKSELASTWRAAAAMKGFLCGSASASGMPGDHPLEVLFQALDDAVGSYEGRDALEETWRTIPAPVGVEFPRMQRFLKSAPRVDRRSLGFPWEPARLDRLRALEAAIGLVRTVARSRPLALCLRRIHWASPMLLEYLEHLIGLSAEVPFALLLTAEQGLEPPELVSMLDSATRKAGVRLVQVVLGPLSDISLEEVLAARYPGNTFSEALVTRLARVADGNPGRLGEMCRRLEEARVLRNEQGAWIADETRPWPFPDTAEEYRLSSILELEPRDFELLEFLAGLGGPVPRDVLTHAETFRYTGYPERTALKALGRMVKVGVMEVAPGGWRFHDLALARALREEAESEVKTRDLEALGGIMADLDHIDPERAARLFEGAGAGIRAVRALRASAGHLEEVGAWTSAARAYRRARLLATQSEFEEELEVAIDLHRSEGNAWHVGGAPAEAYESYTAALVSAEMLDLHGKIAGLRCRRGSVQLARGNAAESEDDFEAALDAAEEVGSATMRRLALLGCMRARLAQGNAAGALEAREAAGAGADAVEPWLRIEEARARIASDDLATAEALLLALAEAHAAEPVLLARALSVLALLYLEQGELDAANQSAAGGLARARELGDSEAAAEALEAAARVADARGDADASLMAWGELFEVTGRTSARHLQVVAGLNAGRRCLDRDEHEAAAYFLARAVALAVQIEDDAAAVDGHVLLGTSNLALNKLYEAQSDFEEAGRKARALGDGAGEARGLLGLGKVYAAQRKKERAKDALARARDAFDALGDPAGVEEATALLEPFLD